MKEFCCAAKQMMNQSCAKTCKFCSETSIIPGSPIQGMPIPSFPGGAGGGGAPSVVTEQDPCDVPNSGDPPSVGINPGSGTGK